MLPNYSALSKGIQELSRTTQTDSSEAEKSQKSQIEARTQAIAELIPTPQQKQFYFRQGLSSNISTWR